MVLDIAFDRQKALEAGMKTSTIRNGSDESIARAKAELEEFGPVGAMDKDYLAWLQKEEECIQVPGMDHWVSDDGVDECIVRANKRDSSYGTLTQFLKAHNIEWAEF